MEYLPLYHNVKDQQCLVVGGGETALGKASLLVRAGAIVTVVTPEIVFDLERLIDSTSGRVQRRKFMVSDLDAITLVVAATDDSNLNKEIAAAARSRKLPVNVVDQPAECSFIFPSIVDRSPVIVAVSSSGRLPVLTRLLRSRLETVIPSAYGRFAEWLGGYRDAVKKKYPGMAERRHFWEALLDGPVSELFLSGKDEQAQELVQQSIAAEEESPGPGEVYLVGAGPGDPDLVTFRALRLMQKADVVLYDNLVSPEILDLVRKDARREYVGKRRASPRISQEALNDMLVRLALDGNRVLRLKGGDPFIFGRGGEEIEKLASHRIPFQVVPGITAASGCACYAGIPLTHRDYSQSVRFVTGHPSSDNDSLQWSEFAHENQTIVFYMGLAGLTEICQKLIDHGRKASTPIALISKGTTPEQRVFTATLATMPKLIEASDVHAPTLIIVGEVVKLRDRLSLVGLERSS
jgi:uroporphyrin-III C-methyltransferase/precorrin-2 dehydrogenase/sirohydrochlorin ferrochelatase